MKKAFYVLLPTLVLCGLIGMGYWAGLYVAAGRFESIIKRVEQGETLGRVLAVTPLNDEQRNHFKKAYSSPNVDATSISWAVPNQPTPFVGTAPSPGQHHNAHVNSWQMRNSEELQMPKPEGVYRIFLTGGSTAYGSGAPGQEYTIGSLLNGLLNEKLSSESGVRYEVFTFANPAWASTQERIAIENYLSELQPDLVISLSGNNDVFWGEARRNVLWFNAFADDYFQILANEALKLAGRKETANLPHAGQATETVSPATVAYRLEKNVRLGAHALQGLKVNWVFFLQPTLSVTRKPLSIREKEFLSTSKDYFMDSYQLIASRLSAVTVNNFQFVDLSGVFDNYEAKEDLFLDQFHFGDKGNVVIARAMFETLAPQVSGGFRKH